MLFRSAICVSIPLFVNFRRLKNAPGFGSEKFVLLPHLSYSYAGFGTLRCKTTQVAGFHRAVPSTALDKDMYSLTPYILYKNSGFVKGNFRQPSGISPH